MNRKTFIGLFAAGFVVASLLLFSGCAGLKSNGKKSGDEMSRELRFSFFNELLEGIKNKNAGNYNAALECYTRAMRIAPGESVSYYEIATVLAINNDFTTALEYAQKACKLSPDNYFYHQLTANILRSNGMIKHAASYYDELIRLKPEILENYYTQAELYMSLDDVSNAVKAFDKAEKYFGVSDAVNTEKFRLATSTNNYKLAYREIDKLIAAFPTDARYRAMLAELYISQKKYREAEITFAEIEKMPIENGLVYMSLAEFYRIKNDIDKVFYYLNLAFESNDLGLDNKIEILYNLIGNGQNATITGHTYTLLETLVRVHPDEPKAHTIYADYLVRDSRWSEAQGRFNIVLASVKSLYELWDQALYIDNQLHDWQSMYQRSSEAIQYFPLQVMPYMYRTVSASMLQKYDEAVLSAQSGLKYSLGNTRLQVDFYTYMAESLHKLGKNQASDSAFEALLRIDSLNVYAINNYAYFLSLRNEKIERALQLSTQLIQLQPANANYLDTRAWVLFRNKNYAEALVVIESAIEKGGSGNPTILEHYGDISYFNGNTDKAVEYWQKALDAGSDSKLINEKIKQQKYIE